MKKINIGLILIIIAIISVIIYSVNEEKVRNEDRKNVEAICSEYLNLHSKFFMLEEEYRDINKIISKEEYNKYLSEIKKEISEYVVAEKVDYTFEKYKEILDEQLDGSYILKQVDRKINEIISYNSDGVYMSIVFMANYTINKDIKISPDGLITSNKGTIKLPDYMVFKKIGNEYKIVVDSTLMIYPRDHINNSDDLYQ